MKSQQAFEIAAKSGNVSEAETIASRALQGARNEGERKMWRKRLEALKQGRQLKFSRQEVRNIK